MINDKVNTNIFCGSSEIIILDTTRTTTATDKNIPMKSFNSNSKSALLP